MMPNCTPCTRRSSRELYSNLSCTLDAMPGGERWRFRRRARGEDVQPSDHPPALPPGGCRARAGRRRAGERCRLRSPPPPLSVARDLAGAAQRARRVAHQPRALIWSPYIHGGSGAATPRGLPRRAPRSVVSLVCVRVCECRGARPSHGAAAARARAAAGARAARGSCRRLPACRCVRSAGQAAGGARGRPSRAGRAARAGRPCSCWAWPKPAIS